MLIFQQLDVDSAFGGFGRPFIFGMASEHWFSLCTDIAGGYRVMLDAATDFDATL